MGQDLHHLIWLYWNFFVWKVCVHLLHHSMLARQLQPSVVTMAQLVESLGTALRWAQALQTFEETGCVSLVHAVSLGESMWRTYYWWQSTDKQMQFVSRSVPEWPTIYSLLRLVRQYPWFHQGNGGQTSSPETTVSYWSQSRCGQVAVVSYNRSGNIVNQAGNWEDTTVGYHCWKIINSLESSIIISLIIIYGW